MKSAASFIHNFLNHLLIILLITLSSIIGLSQGTRYILACETDPEEAGASSELEDILEEYDVIYYDDAFPGASTPSLQRARMIIPSDTSEIQELEYELEQTELFDAVDIVYESVTASCEDPVEIDDAGSLMTDHLDLMELPCAWTITQGSNDITVGVIDVFFSTDHSDLLDNISIGSWGTCPTNRSSCDHGFGGAGAVSALHNSICVAGSGYETLVKGYCVTSSICTTGQPAPAVWPAYLEGNKVINASWRGMSNSSTFADAIEEITMNGVTVVVAAYLNGHSTYANIPGVINVGSADDELNYIPQNQDLDENVDVCVPVSGQTRIYRLGNVQDVCRESGAGSSIAAPHVAGTVALMLSVNPCLTPATIEEIIKETSKPITNADEVGDAWYGLLNAGSLNAYEAVLAAKEFGNYTITGNETWTTEKYIHELHIEAGAELTVESTVLRMSTDAKVYVKRGGRLIIDNTLVTNACGDRWTGIEFWVNTDFHKHTNPYITMEVD
jgi:subtilisin family serine protease